MTNLQVALVAGIDPARTRPGGTRSYVLGLARYLASVGVDVTLVGIGGPAAEEDPFEFVAAIPDPSASSLAFHRGLTRVVRAQKVPAGVVHTQRPDDLVPFLPKFAASGLFITIHGDPLPGIRNRHGRVISAAYRRLERRGISAARRVLFVDRHSRDVFARRYASQSEKFVDSSVGIDLDSFRVADEAGSRTAWRLGDGPTVLFAGRLEREKNLSLLLRALPLCETRPTLVLAGAGSESKVLERQLNRSSHRVLGVVPHGKMASLYAAVDATILPSAREAIDDLREHDREVLEFLSQEPASQVAFQGLRRRLGIHPEQLSRALHRLAEGELVERTELGYRVTPRALGVLSPSSFRAEEPGVTILQTYLPADVDLRSLVQALRGTWIGPLRWYGLTESDDGMRLGWTLEDDTIRLETFMRPGQLIVVAHVASPERLDQATHLGHQLFQHVVREASRDLHSGMSS